MYNNQLAPFFNRETKTQFEIERLKCNSRYGTEDFTVLLHEGFINIFGIKLIESLFEHIILESSSKKNTIYIKFQLKIDSFQNQEFVFMFQLIRLVKT